VAPRGGSNLTIRKVDLGLLLVSCTHTLKVWKHVSTLSVQGIIPHNLYTCAGHQCTRCLRAHSCVAEPKCLCVYWAVFTASSPLRMGAAPVECGLHTRDLLTPAPEECAGSSGVRCNAVQRRGRRCVVIYCTVYFH
jgi:hypothetical protein